MRLHQVKPIVDKVRLYQARLTVNKVRLDQVLLKFQAKVDANKCN